MTNYQINSNGYSAEIRSFGAGLNFLTHFGRNLIDPFQPNSIPERFRGDLLAPWPNRIGDGIYYVDGVEYRATINETSRETALHGLVNLLNWNPSSQSDASITLSAVLLASQAYPTDLALDVTYTLSDDGLRITLSAKNIGTKKAPYGASIHPYLIAKKFEKNDVWHLLIHCNAVLEVDQDRLLPIAVRDVEVLNYDFRSNFLIGNRFIDHAFVVDRTKPSEILLRTGSGQGVRMTFGSECKWIQIHTADRDGGPGSRESLAVEPMNCPPDAFRTGVDLIWLSPNDETSTSWQIQAI